MTFRLEDFLAYTCTVFLLSHSTITFVDHKKFTRISFLFGGIFYFENESPREKCHSFIVVAYSRKELVDGILTLGKAFRYEHTILQAYISNVSDLFDYFLNFSPQFLMVCGCDIYIYTSSSLLE